MPIYRNLAARSQGKAADYVTANAAWVDGAHATIGYFRMEAGAIPTRIITTTSSSSIS